LDTIILKILVAKYSVIDGQVWGGGRNVSSWWKDVCDVREGAGLRVWWWFDVNVLQWVYGLLSNVVGDHTSQFYNTYVFRKEVRLGLQVVWLMCC
jgi:hypothetical protein